MGMDVLGRVLEVVSGSSAYLHARAVSSSPFLELASAWGQAFLLIGIVRPAKPEGLSEWPGGGCGMYSLQGFRHGCFILDSATAKLVWCCCMSHDEPFKYTCNGEMFYSSWECLGAAQLRGCN